VPPGAGSTTPPDGLDPEEAGGLDAAGGEMGGGDASVDDVEDESDPAGAARCATGG
jgi:hypothetical protein